MTVGVLGLLASAGFAAGVLGTAGGITTLISYPALLAAGIAPVAANVTNAVALIGGELAATLTSGRELRHHAQRLRSWAGLSVTGGVAGAVLLLVTPPGLFTWLVPFLIALASALLLAQPHIAARRGYPGTPPARGTEALAAAAVLGTSVYSGYFGAGAGVLILAVTLLLVEADLALANALKNALLLLADAVPGVIFAVAGPVDWPAALALGAGATAGGTIGPLITRRVPHRPLRIVIACLGLGLAGTLVVQAA